MRELNPLLHAQYVPCGNLLPAVPLAWGRSFSSRSRTHTGADFASRPEIRKMLWHFHGFSARSLPCGINPPLYAHCVSRETPVLPATLTDAIPASVEPGFYPSGCGGHKNSENAATFSEFLGREEKPRLRAETKGKTSAPSAFTTQPVRWDTACLRRIVRTKPAVYGRLFAFF